MKEKYRNAISESIRINFDKGIEPLKKLRNSECNCYQFALGSTIPSEICIGERRGYPLIKSTVGEEISYFGRLGSFAGLGYPRSIDEIELALKEDCKYLGVLCESCDDEMIPQEGYRKIALFYDIRNLYKGKFAQFHFIRWYNGNWFHKLNWKTPIIKMRDGLELKDIQVDGLTLIGAYKLSIMQ